MLAGALCLAAVAQTTGTAPLTQTAPATTTASDEIKKQVREVLKDEYRDQKALELETAAAVAARLSEWGKLFAFFVGIPLFLFGGWLTFIGLRTRSDLDKLVARIQQIKDDAQSSETAVLKLKADIAERQRQLDALPAIQRQIDTLSSKVQHLENVSISAPATVAQATKTELERIMGEYQAYFSRLGWSVTAGEKEPTLVLDDNPETENLLAYYRPDVATMVVSAKYADDPDLVLHEYTHRFLVGANAAGTSQERNVMPVESALSSYFPCSFLDKPTLAEKSAPKVPGMQAWNLAQDQPFPDPKAESESVLMDIITAWAGAFWEVREKIGKDRADLLLFRAWQSFRVKPSTKPRAFAKHLLETDAKQMGGKHTDVIRAAFQARGVEV